jgi:hypothetical protein
VSTVCHSTPASPITQIYISVGVSIAKDEDENSGLFVGYLQHILRRVALKTVSIMNVNLHYAGLNMFSNVLFAILMPR